MKYFHFTLGPVQSFVAQARRTRDFWAGSFILSWLAGVAMKAVRKQLEVQKQGGKILFPLPDEDFLQALEQGGTGPQQGNIPNRFKAAVGDNFEPQLVTKTVQAAWHALAELIWQADLQPHLSDAQQLITRAIWERQVNGFWEMAWAMSHDEKESNLLDRRKNWRTYLPAPEPGVKCMLMDGWQELSGLGWPDREKLEKFWKPLRTQMATDLRDGEQLSALAFIKRRFVRHFHNLKASMPGGWELKGWKLPPGVPSVHYMAAAPWLAQLLNKAREKPELYSKMWKFHDAAYQLTGSHSEWTSNIKCVQEADGSKKWKTIDGIVFFDTLLENVRNGQEQTAKHVLTLLKEVRTLAELEPVSPFYAVLLMDGDSLGKQMSIVANQEKISNALNAFTQQAGRIVDENSGFLVYAGGDDVLALLPLEYALPCAAALRSHYMQCMKNNGINSTLSGAIEYVHIRTPLTRVLGDAHHLLDDVAKDGRGRDAIACRVWKPGGLQQEWSMPWEHALQGNKVVIAELAKEFASKNSEFANGFFYRIRELFTLLNPDSSAKESILDSKQASDLITAEYINSGIHQQKQQPISYLIARDIVAPLLDQCHSKKREAKTDGTFQIKTDTHIKADGALLVRFLAQKGVDRR